MRKIAEARSDMGL